MVRQLILTTGHPVTQQANIIIDLQHRDEVLDSWVEVVNDHEIRGFRRSKSWAQDQSIYFYANLKSIEIFTYVYLPVIFYFFGTKIGTRIKIGWLTRIGTGTRIILVTRIELELELFLIREVE